MCEVMKAINPKWASVKVDDSFKGCEVLIRGGGKAIYLTGDGNGKSVVWQNKRKYIINKADVVCVIRTAADLQRLGL